jgi:hypothetical protein
MQIKMTLRFHFTPVGIATKKGTSTFLVGKEISATAMESSMEVPQKTKNRTAL